MSVPWPRSGWSSRWREIRRHAGDDRTGIARQSWQAPATPGRPADRMPSEGLTPAIAAPQYRTKRNYIQPGSERTANGPTSTSRRSSSKVQRQLPWRGLTISAVSGARHKELTADRPPQSQGRPRHDTLASPVARARPVAFRGYRPDPGIILSARSPDRFRHGEWKGKSGNGKVVWYCP